jgi:hypothetical protein
MSDDTDLDVEDALHYLRLVEQVASVALGVWMLWTYVVPVAVKIDLRAWWNEHTKTKNHDLIDIHRSLIDIEVASEAELAAAVERLSRAA